MLNIPRAITIATFESFAVFDFNRLIALMIINKAAIATEPHPVKRTEKKYKVFPASSHSLLAAFYAARPSSCYSIGVNTPSLRCTRLVL